MKQKNFQEMRTDRDMKYGIRESLELSSTPTQVQCRLGSGMGNKTFRGIPRIQKYLLSTSYMLGFGGRTDSLGNQGLILLR